MSLELINLTKTFDQKTLFRDFSYKFQNNGIYLLKGDSGIGKTTLLRIIAGLDKDYTGKVITASESKISYCFQEYRLFPSLSAINNVFKVSFEVESCENLEKTVSLLSALGFSEADMKLKPSKLSGGMKQRIAFARAFLRHSSILLLDEPTKELDEGLSKKMIELIKMTSKDRLVIMVTHKNEEWADLNAIQINL